MKVNRNREHDIRIQLCASSDTYTAAEWCRAANDLGELLDESRARAVRAEAALRKIADPSYVGNYSDREVIEIYRKWALAATGEGDKGMSDDLGVLIADLLRYSNRENYPHDLWERALAVARPIFAGVTHGRHCPCTACANENWTRPDLAPCGMHGPGCPRVYAPSGAATGEGEATDA